MHETPLIYLAAATAPSRGNGKNATHIFLLFVHTCFNICCYDKDWATLNATPIFSYFSKYQCFYALLNLMLLLNINKNTAPR